MKILTIDITALEWFDRINGNSYFSATATINYGTSEEKTVYLPFQYGYGSHYVDCAAKELENAGLLPGFVHNSNGSTEGINQYCLRNSIILRRVKHEGCKKRELMTRKEAEKLNTQPLTP